MDSLNDISPQLMRHQRRLKGYTILRFAKISGISDQTILNAENGKHTPSEETIRKFAEALNVDISVFYPVKADDLRDKATAVVDDYFDDGKYPKDRKARVAVDVMKIPMPEVKPDFQESGIYTGWRNKQLSPFYSQRCMDVKNYPLKENGNRVPLVIVGPTRIGKTFLDLEVLIGLHFANKGMRSLVVRSDAVDLQDTIRPNIREISEYSLDDPISPISAIGRGGSRNFKSLELNEGEMILGGLNRDERLLGTSYDVIFCSQLEQVDEMSFQKMLTRCAGDAGVLKDAHGNNYGLLIAECNPAPDSDHWILRYAKQGKIKLVNFDFTDSPLFYDRDGNITETGENVIGQLDQLEGLSHDLYFKSIWSDVGGKLFELKDDIHLVPEKKGEELQDYTWFRGADFGMKSPSVCIWLGVHRGTKSIYVHREFRHTKMDTIQLGDKINHFTEERVSNTIIDNDENNQMLLRKHSFISTEMTKKSATSIMNRVHILQNMLKNTAEGLDAGITFNKSLRCNADPALIRDKEPLSVIDEVKRLASDDNDKLIGSDHGFDALTYPLLWLATTNQVPVGFGSATAKRQSRI